MVLAQLLEEIPYRLIKGSSRTPVTGISCDSRRTASGEVFVCIRGMRADGHTYLAEAEARGAFAFVLQQEELWSLRTAEVLALREITVIAVPDTRQALALMAAAWYGHPARRLKVIGITGTKGKTTTAYMIREVLRAAGRPAGLIGTVEIDTGKRRIPCVNTTPESLKLQRFLWEMAEIGCEYAVAEVSSQALKQSRTQGIRFRAGVFTNLGRDHIGPGEHADPEEYLQCKRQLFRQCELAVGNGDDPRLAAVWEGTGCRKVVCTVREGALAPDVRQACEPVSVPSPAPDPVSADYRASELRRTVKDGRLGIGFRVSGRLKTRLSLPVPGEFNVMNALEAAAVLRELGIPETAIRLGLQGVQVPGRLEQVPGPEDCRILVDYAHNAMSLAACLRTLKEYPHGRLVVIFGCGGNRSPERRETMGEAAGSGADLTIVTTDNPRQEDPGTIMEDIRRGLERTKGAWRMIEDRQEAVRYALEHRRPGDVILIAGKGHETYQEIRGVRYPMDDRELVKTCMRTLS